jgi:hypothetical protein
VFTFTVLRIVHTRALSSYTIKNTQPHNQNTLTLQTVAVQYPGALLLDRALSRQGVQSRAQEYSCQGNSRHGVDRRKRFQSIIGYHLLEYPHVNITKEFYHVRCEVLTLNSWEAAGVVMKQDPFSRPSFWSSVLVSRFPS